MGLDSSISWDYTNCDKVDKLMLIIAATILWFAYFHSSTINQHVITIIQKDSGYN